MSARDPEPTVPFGADDVPLGDKQARVDAVFQSVAARYDLMNDVMSGGLHRLWKDALVAAAYPRRTGPYRHLDVAGGTGDIVARVLDRTGPEARAVLLDINPDMLAVARDRLARAGRSDRVEVVEGNAEALPFPDRSFDLYTIAFGIRNVPRIERALAEAYRVLKPGGRFLCLEFSHMDVPLADRLYALYGDAVIPRLGAAIATDEAAYRYLVESIRRFPKAEAFAARVRAAGLARVEHRPFTGNVAALHAAWRL